MSVAEQSAQKLQASAHSMNGLARFTEKLLSELSSTREVKELAGRLMPALIRQWAGDATWRKMVSRPVENVIKKSNVDPWELASSPSIPEVFLSPEMGALLLEQAPFLVSTGVGVASAAVQSFLLLKPETRAKVISRALSGLDMAELGKAATAAARIISDLHAQNPAFFAEHLGPALAGILNNIDFGEAVDLYFGATGDVAALARTVGNVFFENPAKMICLASLLPGLANLAVTIANETLTRANELSGELIAEVLLSLMRDVDGKSLGLLVNQGAEILRKIHTGSALLGPPGLPEFTAELTRKLAELGSAIDPALLWKARRVVTEISEARIAARLDLLRNNPELLEQRLREQPSIRNAKIRARRKNMELLADLPDDLLCSAVAEGAVKVDTQDVAEALNLACQVVNRVHETKPDFVSSLLRQFSNAADLSSLAETAQWLTEDLA
ncbi:MAG: hypothetical protein AB1921_04035, partial [Thermodesulfobacteriota bacterium]